MRQLLIWTSSLGLLVSVAGCASVDRRRADYHHSQAKSEAKDLNLGKAVKEEKKAADARRDERRDRW